MAGAYRRGARKPAPPATAVPSRIHEGLVGARALVGSPYLADPTLRAQYDQEIAPRTVAALSKILRESFPEPKVLGRAWRALDLGAGTGAAGVALRRHFGEPLRLTEVDRIATTRATRVADVTDPAALTALGGGFDLVVAAHVLNELHLDREPVDRLARLARLVRRWGEELVGEGGTLILIEPALRETSRVLLGVRDQLLAAGLHVVAPCFFTGPCPALLAERDWCHDSAPIPSRRGADFSYLIVRASGEAASDPTRFRIVSDPLPEKGKLRLFACGIAGRQAVVRLDRHATAANADLDRLARGDVARIVRMTFANDGLRVAPDTVVERVRPSTSIP
jgi:hypothetical protein